ncbi:MAG: mannose-1-phosphate guanylyltransferase/mannose-6-phosphate isomerase [Desulfobacterales bacterium]|nr:mannose-1-phosphate guanylyltransferase/mannose-6-phosphate isomerase [Desulfobacterales bacterium]
MNIFPVILAGGSGTRLWPLSRELYPKQFLSLINEQTLFQNTALRLGQNTNINSPVVICNEAHRFIIAEQLRSINLSPSAIILEPVAKNTAPAIAVAALYILSHEQDGVLLVLPADHYIDNNKKFQLLIEQGLLYAQKDILITFGIVPTSPETGYGYIRTGKALTLDNVSLDQLRSHESIPMAYTIDQFVEKPNIETAKQYLISGNYYWNSGIFMFKASTLIHEMKACVPEIIKSCERALSLGVKDLDFLRLHTESFKESPSDSIDYAIMEKTAHGVMIPMDIPWNDLGSWDALWGIGQKDEKENVTRGDVLLHDVKHSYLHSTERLLAAVGLDNHVVVETVDAVLVSPKDRVQEVKHLVNQLRLKNREESISHRKIYRPWGTHEVIDSGTNYKVSRIVVHPGSVLSLQKHYHRAEHWVVVKGTAEVRKRNEIFVLKEDESTYIPVGTEHQLRNPGRIPLYVIEVQSGSYIGDDDIVRINN